MEYKKLFSRLNEKLAENNLILDLHCIGGFVLEYYGLKATDDIDAFYQSTKQIEKLIDEVGHEFNVNTENEHWLNPAVGELLSPLSTDDQPIFTFSNLTVSISSLQSVLVDKIHAGRAKDIPDIAKLIKKLSIKDPKQLFEIARTSDNLVDPSILFEAYAIAYGEQALENYLKNNPEIKRLLW